ncbi:hypothetical protein BGX38DRAFT_1142010 [Terfezia claveryi]|nr:hypothetical protein BGX38DRAFT_1142010 [Terfezia claveryi]
MSQQPSKRKKFARSSDAHTLPATWVVGYSRVNELQGQRGTGSSNAADFQPNEGQGQQRTENLNITGPIAVSIQPMSNIQPHIHAHYVAPGPQVGSPPVSNDRNAQLQLVCPAWDPQIQHIMDMGFRQGFLQLDKLSMPAAPNVMQDIPQICVNKVRFLLQDFNTSLGTTRRLVAETFRVFASPPGQQPVCPAPGANLAHLAIYQDFRLCALVLNILHDTETALTNHCSNPSARLCRTLLLRYASTFIASEYVLSWYHVFRTDGVDRFDMQLYLNRVTQLLCARLAMVPALFQQRRWLEVFPPQGPGMEVEVNAGAGWDLSMATRLDLLKLLAEYSVYSVNNYTCGYLVSLMEAGNPASEMFRQWSFRG